MKSKNKFLIFTLMLSGVLFSCNNAKYDVIENSLYFAESANSQGIMTSKIAVDDQEVKASFTPVLVSTASFDVDVELYIDESSLNEYNKKNSTNFEVLPAEYYTLPDPTVIKPGTTKSDMSAVKIRPYVAEDGVQYALPLAIKSSAMGVLPVSSKSIILLDKPLIQSVPYMNYRSHLKAEPFDASKSGTWNLDVKDWSLEFWVRMDGFAINNQAIFNISGATDGMYIRFGDAMIDYNLLQIKTKGTQVNTVHHFEKNKWTHVALTYDSGSGLLTIYVNGAKDVTLQTAGGPIGIVTGFDMISSGSTYFRNNCELAQVRFWNTARTASEIESNRFYSMRVTNHMIAYWKMDEGKGDILKDSTPNAHHAHASAPLTWKENIRFDGK